jgi:hypothetical protein
MSHSTIKIRKQYDWMIWNSWGWTSIFAVLAGGLLCIYVVLLFQVNSILAEIKTVESETAIAQRDSTDVQSRIYDITRNITFADLASITQLELHEPRDIAILYMQLPENAVVMR